MRRFTQLSMMLVCLVPGCGSSTEAPNREEPGANAPLANGGAYVFRTEGLGLNVRERPTTASTVVATLIEGQTIEIGCQTSGESIAGTSVWDYLPAYGAYASDAFIYTGYDGFSPKLSQCSGTPEAKPPQPDSPTQPGGPLFVLGFELNELQAKWLRYTAEKVVPEMRGGRDERLDKASVVAWWSLKEGVFDQANPFAYSNCHFPPDMHIGPLETCPNPDNAWQVGLAGVQVTWKTLEYVESVAKDVHPEKSLSEILLQAAERAGFSSGSYESETIVGSSGRFRQSWLLRESAVGFEAVHPEVSDQCFVTCSSGYELTCTWCFSTEWEPSKWFAPNRAASEQAVAEIRAILDDLAP